MRWGHINKHEPVVHSLALVLITFVLAWENRDLMQILNANLPGYLQCKNSRIPLHQPPPHPPTSLHLTSRPPPRRASPRLPLQHNRCSRSRLSLLGRLLLHLLRHTARSCTTFSSRLCLGRSWGLCPCLLSLLLVVFDLCAALLCLAHQLASIVACLKGFQSYLVAKFPIREI